MSLRPPPTAKLAETNLRSCYGVRRLSWGAGLREKKPRPLLAETNRSSMKRGSAVAGGAVVL